MSSSGLAEQVACETALIILESPHRDKSLVTWKLGNIWKPICAVTGITKLVSIT